MRKKSKQIYLLTPQDLKRISKLVRHLERAISELAELRRVTTHDDPRSHYTPNECDIIEEASFIKRQLEFQFKNNPNF